MTVTNNIQNYATFSKFFRGAPDGWTELSRVNFLVGENSSGKTSFINLLQILDSPSFSLFTSFLGDVEGINTPFDVLTRRINTDNLTLGHAYTRMPNRGKDEGADEASSEVLQSEGNFHAKLVTYKAKGTSLEITRLSVAFKNQLISIKRVGQNAFKKEIDLSPFESFKSRIEKISLSHEESSNFKKVKDFHFPSDPSPYMWLPVLAMIFSQRNVMGQQLDLGHTALQVVQYGPMRRKPHRMYYGGKADHSPSGEHVPYVMRDFWKESGKKAAAIKNFGIKSGLFDNISIATVTTKVRDRPFAIQMQKNGRYYYIDELGYGVSQVLPIVADIAFTFRSVGFLIQQPELHLHPRAQAEFGALLYSAANEGHFFVVETHSDYIIDRFRILQSKGEEDPTTQIIYFCFSEEHDANISHLISLRLGRIEDAPEGYRDFFIRESIDQLELL